MKKRTSKTADLPVNLFRRHCRERYGEPVGKVSVHLNVPCPNRARGGCVFCRAEGFTPYYVDQTQTVDTQLAAGRVFLVTRGYRRHFAYFQQETTGAAPVERVLDAARIALADPACVGIILATRPDAVPEPLLAGLAVLVRERDRAVDVLIELGLQSSHERSLAWMNRNHGYEDFVQAVAAIRRHPPLAVGVHLILGLPGEGGADLEDTVRRVAAIGVEAVKFHHLQVVEGTPLAAMYRNTPFPLPNAWEYARLLAGLLALLPERVVVHRLWGTTAPNLLVAPRWGLPPAELARLLSLAMEQAGLTQGCRA